MVNQLDLFATSNHNFEEEQKVEEYELLKEILL
jgi:hypothetical protein